MLIILNAAACPGQRECLLFCRLPFSDSCERLVREKSKLLAALKSKGFHVISTPEQLMPDLPGRSAAEIAALISMYKMRKPVRSANVEQASAQPDSDPSPAELWFRIIHNHMDCRAKRDDLSASLAEVMQSLGEQADDQLSGVYAFLSDVLAGKCPRELSVEEAAIVINLLEQVRSAVDQTDSSAERAFLRGGSWWEKNGNEDQDDESGGETHSPSSRLRQTSSGETRDGSPVLQQFLTSCLAFPKIKRISRCLNPLLVPVSLLNQRQQQLLHQQQDQNTNRTE